MQFNKSQLAWLIVGALIGAMVIAAALTLARRVRPAPIYITPPAPTPTPLPTATPGPMQIYITGEVIHPAVYELPTGTIIQDAVLAAGGFSEAANSEVINLALPLSDGMHIHVPDSESEPAVTSGNAGVVTSETPGGGPININTATLEELDSLPGIGPGIGQRIIEYRQEVGLFAAIEDIMDVSGIGPAKFEQMKDLIVVE